MSAVIVERARERAAAEHAERLDQIAIEVAQVTERSEARASELHMLAVGEIAYFPCLPTEAVAEAMKRLRPHVSKCERQHRVRLLMKRSGSGVRVRRMPDNSKTGPLVEWHNLSPGQSDIIHEHLTDAELKEELQKARLTCERLRAEGKGRFQVEVEPELYYGIRVTRWSSPTQVDLRW